MHIKVADAHKANKGRIAAGFCIIHSALSPSVARRYLLHLRVTGKLCSFTTTIFSIDNYGLLLQAKLYQLIS